jgi:hypothetical protein
MLVLLSITLREDGKVSLLKEDTVKYLYHNRVNHLLE